MPSHLSPTPEHLSIIILNAIKEHHRQLGVCSLALVLKGSKSKLLQNRKLYDSKFFGALFYYPINIIENFIKQLIEKKFAQSLLVTGNPYPVPMLEITPEGKNLLEKKIDIPLEVRRTIKPIVLNESVRETLNLFTSLKNIPEVAKHRNLVESTIWGHLIIGVKMGQLLSHDIVKEEKIKLVLEKKNILNTSRLKELKESLPEDISYEEIKCVLAGEEEDN